MNWLKSSIVNGGVKIPPTWLHLHYYEALNALFRVENALRVFVYVVLKNTKRGKWADAQISSDEGAETTIAAIAKRRLTQDDRFGYLGYRITSPLMHLTSGEIIRLIFSDAYWPLFADSFPASKEIVKTKLEEIGNIRNALAHFRPIKNDDVEVVKQNANQVFGRIENALHNVMRLNAIVPSNTLDPWYVSLKQTAGQHCGMGFRQSENEKWVVVRLIYTCPHVGKPSTSSSYKSWSVLTVKSPSLLRFTPNILDGIIYASESIAAVDRSADVPTLKKVVNFVFGRQTLVEMHDKVRDDLERVIATITNETDLIREDNLARGEIVRTADVAMFKDGDRWMEHFDALHSTSSSDDPAEYWGEPLGATSHFITDTMLYPWMPVEVSDEDEEVPF